MITLVNPKKVAADYGRKKFSSEAERVAFLFDHYQTLVEPLVAKKPKPRKRQAKKAGE